MSLRFNKARELLHFVQKQIAVPNDVLVLVIQLVPPRGDDVAGDTVNLAVETAVRNERKEHLVQHLRRYFERLAHRLKCDAAVRVEKLIEGYDAALAKEVIYVRRKKYTFADLKAHLVQCGQKIAVAAEVQSRYKSARFEYITSGESTI